MLKNLPIIQKTLIAPIIGSALIVVIAVVFFSTSNETRALHERALSADQLMMDTNELLADLNSAHGTLYQVISWQQSGVSANDIAEAAGEAKTLF